MIWIVLLAGTLLVVECFLRLPVIENSKRLQIVAKKITHTIKSNSISDHWKEKVLPSYAGILFWLSIKIFAMILVAVSPMIVIAIVSESIGIKVLDLLATLKGTLASTAIAILYILFRKKIA